ncbi:unnamed protein product, partial [Symbiodinium microadriaticum]
MAGRVDGGRQLQLSFSLQTVNGERPIDPLEVEDGTAEEKAADEAASTAEKPEATTDKKRKAPETAAEDSEKKPEKKKSSSDVLRERATALVAELPEEQPQEAAADEG